MKRLIVVLASLVGLQAGTVGGEKNGKADHPARGPALSGGQPPSEEVRKNGFGFTEAQHGAFWIVHNGCKIALVMQDVHEVNIDLIEWQAPPSGRDYAQPAALHNPTLRGARLSTMWYALRIPGWKTRFARAAVTAQSASYTTETLDSAGNVLGRERVTVSLDPKTHRYGVDVEAELEYPDKVTDYVEFCNFLPAGGADPRPSSRRFPATLIQRAGGSFVRMPRHHCPVGALHHADLKQDGLIAFVGEDWDPVVRLTPDGSPYRADVCHALHDVHILAGPADPSPAGKTRYRGRLRMVVDERGEWDARLKAAEPPTYSEDEVRTNLENWPRVVAGEVCDFERGTDLRTESLAHRWVSLCGGEGAFMRWDRAMGSSGSSSLLLESKRPEARCAAQIGPYYWATPGQPMYVSCRIKTKLGDGYAQVKITASNWVDYQLHELATAEQRVMGSKEWQDVVVGPIVASPGGEFVDLELSVSGQGQAWFDDVLFVPGLDYLPKAAAVPTALIPYVKSTPANGP